jgi:FtsH-binding integral membrane protein
LILQSDNRKIMSKILEIIGLVLLGIMTLSFVGALQPTIEPGLSPLFWGCAGATLMILIYRKRKRKQDGKEN